MLAPQLTVSRTGLTALTIRADPTRVAQILSNLLGNARKYTPRGGRIAVNLNRRDKTGHG
jgi:signal transduction histidine kinase